MDAPERGALMLVRLIGGILMVATVLEEGLYWAKCSLPAHRVPVELVPVLLRLIPAGLAILVWLFSRALAEWISNILDS
jgi:hypothetical protein